MNLEKLNQWLNLVANIGLVAGFILIALQLEQNTRTLQLQAESMQTSATVTAESMFMGDDVASAYATAVYRPHEMTEAEIMQVWGYLSTTMLAAQYAYWNHERGLVSEAEWQSGRVGAASMVNWPFGLAWWNEAKTWHDEKFVAEIDVALKELGPRNDIVDQAVNLREISGAWTVIGGAGEGNEPAGSGFELVGDAKHRWVKELRSGEETLRIASLSQGSRISNNFSSKN